MTSKHFIVLVLVLGVATFAVAGWFATRLAPSPTTGSVTVEQMEALTRPHSPVLGPEDAPVTIVEFFDPACEACRAFHPVVKGIMAEHGDAVRVVIRYTPFHGEASVQAIRLLEVARMQNVFEPVLEAILSEQPRWASHSNMNPDMIITIAGKAGLDVEAARTQMLAPDILAVLNQDREDVVALEVRGTPTFFVNGRALDQFGVEELRALVADEVGWAGS